MTNESENPMMGSKNEDSAEVALKTYWRGLEELAQDPDYEAVKSREFIDTPVQDGAAAEDSDGYSVARREFMKLMGAGIALASTTACTRRPKEKIIPYVNKPQEVTPGIANWYASTCNECAAQCGVLVKTREGRPIKLEGNPEHPLSKGGLCAVGQASVLNLYDPDRSTTPALIDRAAKVRNGTSWDELDKSVVSALREARSSGAGVRLLTGELTGTTHKLVEEFAGLFANGKHVAFEAVSEEDTALAQRLSYGDKVLPRYRFEKAHMVLSFGADFLGTWGNTVENLKNWSASRRPETGKMSRLVVFEPIMSNTGSNSDTRVSVAPGDQLKVALAVAAEVVSATGRYASDATVSSLLSKHSAAQVAKETGVSEALIIQTAKELVAARGAGIVLGGGQSARGALGVALDVVANLINSALDNEGSTIDGVVTPSSLETSTKNLLELVADMNAGRVSVLFVHGINPVYSLDKTLGFSEALKKVAHVVSLSRYNDETTRLATVHAPDHHDFESWGDAEAAAGVWSIRQPTIEPLHKTRAFEDSLIAWAKGVGAGGAIGTHATFYDYLRNNWQQNVSRAVGNSAPFASFWDDTLRSGTAVSRSALGSSRARSFSTSSLATAMSAVPALKPGLKTVLYSKVGLGDGRQSNNSWLQELPDPVTKITWDNYVCLSPGKAKELGLKEADIVQVKTEQGTIEGPVHLQPGNHRDTVAIALGYGRTDAGRVGNGVGMNAYSLLSQSNGHLHFSGSAVALQKTGGVRKLACTQGHHSMEGREIIKETTFGEYKQNPASANEHHHKLVTLWGEHKYDGYRWGMVIDQTACTGCGACVIGCQAENNIPVVGYKDAMNGREMHWMRIDRYYSGDAENPETSYQPMLCQHCENAPCETVCPVLATTHDDEGINQQTYNRCVGTRYCANNCPYKVRRFNWFTYTDVAAPQHMQYNPDVTVRTRGVMEKCNFCSQRIRDAKHRAKDLGRAVVDGEIQTACQQSCPTNAISFGNLNDKSSAVAKATKDARGYHVLAEINVKPSITYLTKIRNKTANKASNAKSAHHS